MLTCDIHVGTFVNVSSPHQSCHRWYCSQHFKRLQEEKLVRKKLQAKYQLVETRKDGTKFTNKALMQAAERLQKLSGRYDDMQKQLVEQVCITPYHCAFLIILFKALLPDWFWLGCRNAVPLACQSRPAADMNHFKAHNATCHCWRCCQCRIFCLCNFACITVCSCFSQHCITLSCPCLHAEAR